MTGVLVATDVCRWRKEPGGPVPVLRDVTLRVDEAEVVAVLGRSGSGSTALLACCGCLDPPDRGQVLIGGRDVTRLARAEREAFLQRTIGWVTQRPRLLPMLTVQENVAVVMRIAGAAEEAAAEAAQMGLEAVGLERRAHRLAGELSTAEQRRLALARALVRGPALLVADQPTALLDPGARQGVLNLLRDAADAGAAVLIATRDRTTAAVADRVLVMEAGTVEATGPPPGRGSATARIALPAHLPTGSRASSGRA
ncbi:MAG TPA: ATP-binding cassette domain-containing protein [Candidatus Dormibacteraeota bacterium]|nr:ATP-binding cassette domain-containing protein [Candidatus Dormibacteraeota bacterium]